ncbi:hypothetical protein MTO96_015597 [Rhipicephalus appendiculatus]
MKGSSSEEVEERSDIDSFVDELHAICNALETTDTEETDEGTDEYFFDKIFKRMRGSVGEDRNSTDQGRGKGRGRGRGRGSGKGRGSRTLEGEGEARNSSKGRGFLKKLFEKKKGAGNSSSDSDGASKKAAILKKLLGRKDGSSDASDFLKKYFEGKGALYAAQDEELSEDDVHLEEFCAVIFENDEE